MIIEQADLGLVTPQCPSKEAQDARLASLAGKRLLFVGGDFMYKSFAPPLVKQMQRLRSLGVIVTGVFQEQVSSTLSEEEDKSAEREASQYLKDMRVGECIDAEIFADVGAENGAENIVRAVRAAGLEFDACWSMHEATQPIMAGVQELLSLPGNPVGAYEIARDKYATREVLKEHNLLSIQAMQIWKPEEAPMVGETIGFPMIIKPTVGMGSSGVYRVNTQQELVQTLERLFEDIKSDWTLNRNNIGRQAPVIAETFVLPTIFSGMVNEHDVEVLMWDGEVVYSNIIDNLTTKPPYFQEVGSCAPTAMSAAKEQAMKEYAAKCVKAMGFNRGGFHVECWDTDEGPILIEVNSRIGGGATNDTHVACWGVDPMFEFAMTMLDVPISPPRSETALVTYGYLLPNAEVTGHLAEQIDFLDFLKKNAMHKAHKYFATPNKYVKGNDKFIAEWLGEVHLEYDGDKNDQVLKEMKNLLDEIAERSSAQTTPMLLPQHSI